MRFLCRGKVCPIRDQTILLCSTEMNRTIHISFETYVNGISSVEEADVPVVVTTPRAKPTPAPRVKPNPAPCAKPVEDTHVNPVYIIQTSGFNHASSAPTTPQPKPVVLTTPRIVTLKNQWI